VGRLLSLDGVTGSGPDVLLACSLSFVIVYALWSPVGKLFCQVKEGWGRDGLVLIVALSPMLTTLVHVPGCTGSMRWARLILPCAGQPEEEKDGLLPALPHLADFNLGILLAACWDRFISDLKPLGGAQTPSGLHLLPWPAARRWAAGLSAWALLLMTLFVPLGQVFFYTDLEREQVSTPLGQLGHGPHTSLVGPSAFGLLAALWPIGVWAAVACLCVSVRGLLAEPLRAPVGELEHLGANVLYYIVVINVFLAGLGHGGRAKSWSIGSCLLIATGILAAGRFLHRIAKAARK
jgi:hypothetical protein